MDIHPVSVEPHPLLDVRCLRLELPRALGDLPSPPELHDLLRADASAPMTSSDAIRTAVRDLLRASGFKPTGRSKPSAEYLLRASEEGRLAPINLLVDLGNAVSLHSGLPISVIDLERATPPLRIAIATPGTQYVFNAAGQEIDVGSLLCLCDQLGACANAVKDAQRTKTTAATRRALAVSWGTSALPGRTADATRWLAALARRAGVEVSDA